MKMTIFDAYGEYRGDYETSRLRYSRDLFAETRTWVDIDAANVRVGDFVLLDVGRERLWGAVRRARYAGAVLSLDVVMGADIYWTETRVSTGANVLDNFVFNNFGNMLDVRVAFANFQGANDFGLPVSGILRQIMRGGAFREVHNIRDRYVELIPTDLAPLKIRGDDPGVLAFDIQLDPGEFNTVELVNSDGESAIYALDVDSNIVEWETGEGRKPEIRRIRYLEEEGAQPNRTAAADALRGQTFTNSVTIKLDCEDFTVTELLGRRITVYADELERPLDGVITELTCDGRTVTFTIGLPNRNLTNLVKGSEA